MGADACKITVSGLAITAVKGTRLRPVQEIELDELGARGDRIFCVVDERGRMVNGKQLGGLQTVVSDYDRRSDELTLTFPSGDEVTAPVRYDGTVEVRFFSRQRQARPLRGPWADALSEFLGRSLRLMAPDIAVDRGRQGAVSVISRASLNRLAQVAGEDSVDGRRFRMLIEIDGVDAHEEDRWVARRARVGSARVALRGHVGRCLVTSRDPESGEVDLPTLELLGGYRRGLDTTEPLPFGIYGQVLEPGSVRVGDSVTLDG